MASFKFTSPNSLKICALLTSARDNAQRLYDEVLDAYNAQVRAIEEFRKRNFFYQLFHKTPHWDNEVSAQYYWAKEFIKEANQCLQIADLGGEFSISKSFLRDINYYKDKQ